MGIQQVFDSREPIGIDIGYEVLQPVSDLAAEIAVYNGGCLTVHFHQPVRRVLADATEPGRYLTTCWIPADLMTEDSFFVQVGLNQLHAP
jgi:hypothetical protein